MEKTKEHAPSDRYMYDFGLCSGKSGWAQIDTTADAPYYGAWANPLKLLIFEYCEGDCTLTKCEVPEEFVAEIRLWAELDRFKGIDCMMIDEIYQGFRALGCADLTH